MIGVQAEIPQAVCEIDDALEAICHGRDTACIGVFKARGNRNRFQDETAFFVRKPG